MVDNHKIFVAICSCNKEKNVKLRDACRKTWLSDIPTNIEYKFFVGSGYDNIDENADVINLNVDDDYWGLPGKVAAIYKWVEDNIDYDYVFKCDDDTYVVLERLVELTINNHDFIGNEFLYDEKKKFASGGAGYFISKKIMPKILKEKIGNRGLEDVTFSKLALKHAESFFASGRLHFDNSGMRDDDVITAHWLSVSKMFSFHNKLKNVGVEVVKVKHPHWKRNIELYPNDQFSSSGQSDSGHYKKIDECLYLYWYNWDAEKFKLVNDRYEYDGKC